MTQITITVENLDRILRTFEQGEAALDRELKGGMHQALGYGHGFLARYPPPLPAGTYRRTGTLGRRWTAKLETGARLVGWIGNVTPYAPYVQDRDRQAWMHVGRWQTVQELAEEPHLGRIVGLIQDAVNRWAQRMEA